MNFIWKIMVFGFAVSSFSLSINAQPIGNSTQARIARLYYTMDEIEKLDWEGSPETLLQNASKLKTEVETLREELTRQSPGLIKSAEELNEVQVNGTKVSEMINDKLAAIGEKIAIKFERVEAAYVASYIHGANRMGVLVGFNKDAADAGKDVAMQIAAMNPQAIDESSIAPETIAREREIAIEQIKAEGKPAEMAEKIAIGKVNKFFKDNTLLAQAFVKDNSKSVADYLKGVNADLKITEFKRVALG